MVERAGEVVRHREDVTREPGCGIGAGILHVLLQTAAHVLRLCARIEHVLLGRVEIGSQRGESLFEAARLAFVVVRIEEFLGHAFEFLFDGFVVRPPLLLARVVVAHFSVSIR